MNTRRYRCLTLWRLKHLRMILLYLQLRMVMQNTLRLRDVEDAHKFNIWRDRLITFGSVYDTSTWSLSTGLFTSVCLPFYLTMRGSLEFKQDCSTRLARPWASERICLKIILSTHLCCGYGFFAPYSLRLLRAVCVRVWALRRGWSVRLIYTIMWSAYSPPLAPCLKLSLHRVSLTMSRFINF